MDPARRKQTHPQTTHRDTWRRHGIASSHPLRHNPANRILPLTLRCNIPVSAASVTPASVLRTLASPSLVDLLTRKHVRIAPALGLRAALVPSTALHAASVQRRLRQPLPLRPRFRCRLQHRRRSLRSLNSTLSKPTALLLKMAKKTVRTGPAPVLFFSHPTSMKTLQKHVSPVSATSCPITPPITKLNTKRSSTDSRSFYIGSRLKLSYLPTRSLS